jgi:hypothetical protein
MRDIIPMRDKDARKEERKSEREGEKEREREEGRKGTSLFIADITEGCSGESYCGFIGRPLALVSDQSRVSTEIRSPD